MKILVACEESQAVTRELRRLGHEAYSCDIEPCSGGHPEWHLQQDVLPLLTEPWDMIIAHPPCTYLTVAGNKWFKPEYRDRFPDRLAQMKDAIEFFMKIAAAPAQKIAIENPVGRMSGAYRKPDQIIQPWQFGHPVRKATCLWLKNLPPLVPACIVPYELDVFPSGNTQSKWHTETGHIKDKKERSKLRAKTFPGIARAMAEQWAGKADIEGRTL
jgi:hypothetical protein